MSGNSGISKCHTSASCHVRAHMSGQRTPRYGGFNRRCYMHATLQRRKVGRCTCLALGGLRHGLTQLPSGPRCIPLVSLFFAQPRGCHHTQCTCQRNVAIMRSLAQSTLSPWTPSSRKLVEGCLRRARDEVVAALAAHRAAGERLASELSNDHVHCAGARGERQRVSDARSNDEWRHTRRRSMHSRRSLCSETTLSTISVRRWLQATAWRAFSVRRAWPWRRASGWTLIFVRERQGTTCPTPHQHVDVTRRTLSRVWSPTRRPTDSPALAASCIASEAFKSTWLLVFAGFSAKFTNICALHSPRDPGVANGFGAATPMELNLNGIRAAAVDEPQNRTARKAILSLK